MKDDSYNLNKVLCNGKLAGKDGLKNCNRKYLDNMFCRIHQYQNNYTEEEFNNMKVCGGCKRPKYTADYKICIDCRNRSKNKKKIETIKCELCKNKGSYEYENKHYCGKHIKSIKRKDMNLCSSRWSCGNEPEENKKWCRNCLDRDKEYNKKRKQKKLESIKIENGEKLCKNCFVKFEPFNTLHNVLSTKCKECYKKQQIREANRKPREEYNKKHSKEYEQREDVKEKRNMWKIENYKKC